MDYSGKIITKNPVEPSQTSAPGVWTLDQATQAVQGNNWPIAYVPNPISRSLRFNSADSAYLNRTFSTPTNNKIWTWSAWVKRAGLVHSGLLSSFVDDNNRDVIQFEPSTDMLRYVVITSGSAIADLVTTQVFRDPSAWYHLIVSVDTTQATSSNRIKMYVNGVQITSFGTATYPSQNANTYINSASNVAAIGRYQYSSPGGYASLYMTEVHFIDGQALDPTSFGMTDPRTGAWIPKKYSGTYGTNGFYLNFSDNSSTAALGTDYSGNSNTWTTNNFSVTAGSGNDSMTDVPTPWIPYNTTGDVGGVVRGNYCTMNGVDSTNITLSNGNLTGTQATSWQGNVGTFLMTSGKWYWEVTGDDLYNTGLGVIIPNSTLYNQMRTANSGWVGAADGGFGIIYNGAGTAAIWYSNYYTSYSISNYLSSGSNGDVLQVAFDADSGKIWIGKNNTWGNNGTGVGDPANGTNPADTLTTTELSRGLLPFFSYESGQLTLNAGQRAFAYTPPAGFKSLCTTNLPEPTVLDGGDYFNAVLYTGNGTSSNSITGVGFQPDLVWIKPRNTVSNHALYDAVRGVNLRIKSNSTDAESTLSGVSSFDSDGFSLGSAYNETNNHVAWNWKESATSGFDIVTYTGDGTSNRTINHNLGVAPYMIITKQRNGTNPWLVQFNASTNTDQYLYLNSSAAYATYAGYFLAATSTTYGWGTSDPGGNGNGLTYVSYLFAAVPGFSAFGSYTGNGSSDGVFVYLGFRARYLMLKSSSGTGGWVLLDTARDPYNDVDNYLYADSSAADQGSSNVLDINSNGFKIRNSWTDINGSGTTYIYAAFAENPFKYSNAR